MDFFNYKDGVLHAEDIPVARLADELGTPLYIYSHATLERHWQVFNEGFAGMDHLVCFSVKANSNLGLLSLFAKWGSGFDIVSSGELARCLRAGGEASKIVFSGVGKRADEMKAALEAGILMFNVESEQELDLLSRVASDMRRKAPISIRVNPDVDPKTHPYISTGLKKNKFGINLARAEAEYRRAMSMPGIEIVGLDCHIGSQLTQVSPFVDAAKKLVPLVESLRAHGANIKLLDIGGGLGIPYKDEQPPSPLEYGRAVTEVLKPLGVRLVLEPGRVIVGNAGLLVTRLQYFKKGDVKNFYIVDAAMNDLIRPALYDAYQEVVPVVQRNGETVTADVVGPICESGDFLARDAVLPKMSSGELLAVRSAGAYGFTMASNYNTRPRAAEVLVKGSKHQVVRQRETVEQLLAGESTVTL